MHLGRTLISAKKFEKPNGFLDSDYMLNNCRTVMIHTKRTLEYL